MNKLNFFFLIVLILTFTLSSTSNLGSSLSKSKLNTQSMRMDVRFPGFRLASVPGYPGDGKTGVSANIQSLGNSQQDQPDTPSEAVNHSTCAANSGFGFNGRCLSQTFGTQSSTNVPQDASDALSFLYQIMYKIAMPFDICLGDYAGGDYESNNNLKHAKCDGIPLMEEFKYGTIGGYVDNVSCPTPVKIAFCAAFDRCGTVALSVNAGLAQCAATYSTGIASIIAPVSGVLDYISFGFSPKRRFKQEITIAYRDGDKVASKQVTTYGHFLVGLGLGFPMKDLKLGGKSLEELFSLDVSATFTVDFGNSLATVTNIISSLKTANKNTGKELVKQILNTNAEMTLQVKGVFSINLNDLTKGFLPNLEFNLGEANVLVSSGGANNASGMKAGIYVYFKRDLSSVFKSIFDKIVGQFKSILKVFGIDSIPFPSVNVSLGIFIDSNSAGFEFFGLGMELRCMFIFNGTKGACDFNHKFFTAIVEGAKWVIKEAAKFFDDAGKEVIEFANDVGRFAENAANETKKFFENDVRNFFERDVANTGKAVVNTVGNFFTNDVANTGKTVVNEVKNFFSGW